MDGASAIQALTDGVFCDNTIAGAVAYHASGGKSFFKLFDEEPAESSRLDESVQHLPNGRQRRVKGARNVSQLAAMGGVSVPDNLEELISQGLDLGLPIEAFDD